MVRKLAIFASGSGSNFEAIVQAVQAGRLPGVEVALLVCDKPQAKVLERAERLGIEAFVFQPKDYANKAAFEAEVVQELQKREISLVVLAGYMRLVGETLLAAYEGSIINLHPSLLPAFPGKDAIGQALAYGVKITGVTVHLVDAGLDTGPIIAQVPVAVQEQDTAETLAARIHAVEHGLLVEVIGMLAEGRVQVAGRQVQVRS
ncbi:MULTISPECIES: phosphoribosylglycinamide formyltransferase [Brevibacillus]|jgi:phosphoribosylglycinamide formyltransferase-1|uniref:Phosphoribosylglycinamide formyltransferase n=1 Tax=Brevibacillus parabrevis TaxID=54914 RepID=A0A4Y3PIJ8_BREPA|nr:MULTISPECIES: phosphoribosylglycinamide formyltransferase [Brevibacillus]TGV28042.1 phosphoribosylglycinamide formyltransferase [Mesorhizobium sp. M00.F.Ca.ET.186.01.1.1]MBU8715309.1 phosphoribosylglycinamide formyltransferase [Brevibacillus parabrevis]MDR4999757.1 phosphoribosylglycinamide formyltransferase [Brevibacillus parabrevis]MED1724907.1 phosphoribosylglycinamide formyltransferase [Brevibacillus parabrevis]MED2257087.1 phosphoribosylglycinamide formyltransferase [Brevibacillus para